MEKRIDNIDVEKGIGAVLVILGHAGITGFPKIVLYSFHIPLFFFLSGIFIKYDPSKRVNYVLKRIRTILLPYCLFYILLFAKEVLKVILEKGGIDELNSLLFGMILQMRTTEYSGSFWFLPVLFEATLICGISEEFVIKLKNEVVRYFISAILFICGYGSIVLLKKPLLWNFDAALIASSFMIIGRGMKEHFMVLLSLKKNTCIKILVISIIGNIGFALLNYKITGRNSDLYWMVIGNPVLYLLSAYCGITAITMLTTLYKPKICIYIGINSLLFYCLHHEFVFPVVRNITSHLPLQMLEPYYMTVITCLIIAPMCVLIRKYCPLLAGIKK